MSAANSSGIIIAKQRIGVRSEIMSSPSRKVQNVFSGRSIDAGRLDRIVLGIAAAGLQGNGTVDDSSPKSPPDVQYFSMNYRNEF